MFEKKTAATQRDDTAGEWQTRRADELARLWRRVILATLMMVAVWGAGMVFAMCAVVLEFKSWHDALPAGAPVTLQRIVADRPAVLLASVAAVGAGLVFTVFGLVVLRLVLGRKHWAPRKVVLFVAALPLCLIALGGGAIVLEHGPISLLVMPLMVGFATAMIPLVLGVLASALLRLSLRQLRQRPMAVEEDDLPVAAAEYFNRHVEAAERAGLTRLGDFSYRPGWKKYRRYWMAPNGAYLVEATWVSLSGTTFEAACVFSATSDGRYFETVDHDADLPPIVPLAGEPIAHIEMMPDASLDDLIERHVQLVAAWVAESGCRPLKFAATDLHALSLYGIAAHMSESDNPLLSLGNPYLGHPLPPLPGEPWYPQNEPQPAPAAT